jgi:hypothetical protein
MEKYFKKTELALGIKKAAHKKLTTTTTHTKMSLLSNVRELNMVALNTGYSEPHKRRPLRLHVVYALTQMQCVRPVVDQFISYATER